MINKNTNVFRMMSLGRAGLVLGLSAMAAFPGLAAASSYQLSYNTSEFESVESVRALHLRIRRAARAYCPDYGVVKNLNERASCIKDVENDLVSRVDHPLLTRVHSGDVVLAIASTSR